MGQTTEEASPEMRPRVAETPRHRRGAGCLKCSSAEGDPLDSSPTHLVSAMRTATCPSPTSSCEK